MWRKQGRVETMPMSSQGRSLRLEGELSEAAEQITGATELDEGTDSQCRTDVNWVPGILDPKSQISKTQHH
jgi:hypothetical protein